MTRADVEALRGHGCSDAEIFEVAFTTAYFNYTNRVAEGLGVEPEAAVSGEP
jgi:alkylhydroperoxidase family enzyme